MDIHDSAMGHVNRAWDWFAGMVALSATNLGIELGLFDYLKAHGPATPGQLAEALQLQPRPVDLWAKTLLQHGLLHDAGNDRVELSEGLDLVVCEPRTVFYLAPSFVYHAQFVARDFLDLAPFFRTGTTIAPSRHGAPLTMNVAEQTAMLHAVLVTGILPTLPEVQQKLVSGCRVLDAACGTANLGALLCTTYEGLQYTGVELDEAAIEVARGVIAGGCLGDRMNVRHGNIATDLEVGAFDVAFLVLSLHEIAMQTRPQAISGIARSLKPDGLLLLLDESYPESLEQAADESARMGLHFEYTEMLWGSRVATEREIDELLAQAGLIGERVHALPGSFQIIVARKT